MTQEIYVVNNETDAIITYESIDGDTLVEKVENKYTDDGQLESSVSSMPIFNGKNIPVKATINQFDNEGRIIESKDPNICTKFDYDVNGSIYFNNKYNTVVCNKISNYHITIDDNEKLVSVSLICKTDGEVNGIKYDEIRQKTSLEDGNILVNFMKDNLVLYTVEYYIGSEGKIVSEEYMVYNEKGKEIKFDKYFPADQSKNIHAEYKYLNKFEQDYITYMNYDSPDYKRIINSTITESEDEYIINTSDSVNGNEVTKMYLKYDTDGNIIEQVYNNEKTTNRYDNENRVIYSHIEPAVKKIILGKNQKRTGRYKFTKYITNNHSVVVSIDGNMDSIVFTDRNKVDNGDRTSTTTIIIKNSKNDGITEEDTRNFLYDDENFQEVFGND